MSKARNQRLKSKRKLKKAAEILVARMTDDERARLEKLLKEQNA